MVGFGFAPIGRLPLIIHDFIIDCRLEDYENFVLYAQGVNGKPFVKSHKIDVESRVVEMSGPFIRTEFVVVNFEHGLTGWLVGWL